VNILLSSPYCSSSQHSPLQSTLYLQSTFPSPVHSVTSHQTNHTLSPTSLQTSPFLSTPNIALPLHTKHRPSTVTSPSSHCRLSWPPPAAPCMHSGAQQQYQLSAPNSPKLYITFVLFIFFCCQQLLTRCTNSTAVLLCLYFVSLLHCQYSL
jgi:hypothetical protein